VWFEHIRIGSDLHAVIKITSYMLQFMQRLRLNFKIILLLETFNRPERKSQIHKDNQGHHEFIGIGEPDY
jgi:hypothetical protein